jgi:hypothetical protein
MSEGCIRNKLSQKIGCRPEWDSWSDKTRQVCSQMEQLIQFEKEYTEIALLNQREIPKHTGCPIPCKHFEYKLADTAYKGGETPMLMLIQTTNSVIVRTEELVYPLFPFITEFGGALGLFLGFSFMMIWDAGIVAIFSRQPGAYKRGKRWI